MREQPTCIRTDQSRDHFHFVLQHSVKLVPCIHVLRLPWHQSRKGGGSSNTTLFFQVAVVKRLRTKFLQISWASDTKFLQKDRRYEQSTGRR
jgi:hypothetical protein